MATEPATAFSDNWSYLRTELSWLDRVLMLAVARYRQEKRGIDRVAQTHADRVSSHWWKGVVSLGNNIAYDEHRKVAKSTNAGPKASYNQQLEARIKASQTQGIVLALPTLRDRLKLTPFEKNVVLLSLAPEVNRRYAHLYRYLQGQDDALANDLPTVELVLRLLCRNDNEWRTARQQIAQQSSLFKQGLLTLLQQPHDTLLTTSLKLSEPLVRYLLAEKPIISDLDSLLLQTMPSIWSQPLSSLPFHSNEIVGQAIAAPDSGIPEIQATTSDDPVYSQHASLGHPYSHTSHLQCINVPATDWGNLILPDHCLEDLHHLCKRVRHHHQMQIGPELTKQGLEKTDGSMSSPSESPFPGSISLFVGAAGTGKSLAGQAIATDLQASLHWVDLNTVAAEQHQTLLKDAETVPILFIKAAYRWLSNPAFSTVHGECIRYFLAQRRRQGQLTIFSVQEIERIAPKWLQEIDQMIRFPFPDRSIRLKMWETIVTSQCAYDKTIDLNVLSTLTLSGKDILRVVQDGAIAAAARQSPLTLDDIRQALKRQDKSRVLRQLAQRLARNHAKSTSKRARRRTRKA